MEDYAGDFVAGLGSGIRMPLAWTQPFVPTSLQVQQGKAVFVCAQGGKWDSNGS